MEEGAQLLRNADPSVGFRLRGLWAALDLSIVPETPHLVVTESAICPHPCPPEPLLPHLCLRSPPQSRGEEGGCVGLGVVLELAGGEEQYRQKPDVELFCFQKLPGKPSGFPPPQVERCLCVCGSLPVGAKEGKVSRESAVRDCRSPRPRPGAGVGSLCWQGLLPAPGK